MGIKMKLATAASTAILALGVGVLYQARDSDDNYSLSVLWKPSVLSPQNPVDIRVTVDGVQIIGRTRHLSPWHETMTAEPGAAVILTAVTSHPSVFRMECTILVGGKVPSTGFNAIVSAGAVKCFN